MQAARFGWRVVLLSGFLWLAACGTSPADAGGDTVGGDLVPDGAGVPDPDAAPGGDGGGTDGVAPADGFAKPDGPFCGDGVCDGGEDAVTCATDCAGGEVPGCGEVPAGLPCCGDGICGGPETADNCVLDCGPVVPDCGNGICDVGEDATSCPNDCPGGEVVACDAVPPGLPCCGDAICDGPETAANCPADCGPVTPTCGDGVCDPGETEATCPADCGPVTPTCGDGVCDPGEAATCLQDCPPGPAPCVSDLDCTLPETCPPDAALGCVCREAPTGESVCMPACLTDADCPVPPTGGTLVCSAEGTCGPPTEPPPDGDETCDGRDDDADGLTDEDFAARGSNCGVGACARSGQVTCSAGAEVDSCEPGLPAANDATCDGIDDDCDGDRDEDGACAPTPTYPLVDTNQTRCYGADACMPCPAAAFSGQDAQYASAAPRYAVNGDGTVSDLVTGLMWQRDPGAKQTYSAAVAGADSSSLGGYTDWRVPTIKELYSLVDFSGLDPSGYSGSDPTGLLPFIDADVFVFAYGDTGAGQRLIDSQWVTRSIYTATVMGGAQCFFGVNFADGRIKCYPTQTLPGQGYFAIYVRGGAGYGENDFHDNGDGTVSDRATGLLWQQGDSGAGMVWQEALDYCETLDLAGHADWRLPNAKELQSLVDYARAPDTTASPALDPVFDATPITNEAGQTDYGCYWSGTTHANWTAGHEGGNAAYVAFGRAMGYMNGSWMDVHGAGAQRSDPKAGDPDDYPTGHGPQGDAIRIFNFVRCVRAGDVTPAAGETECPAVEEPVCGDGVCAAGEETSCPADCGSSGPTPCTVETDCDAAGACPPDATLGCTCAQTPTGRFCVPSCTTSADCPQPPGQTLVCGPQGFCVPQGGPPPGM